MTKLGSNRVNVEKDLETRKFKKDPFENKYQEFLETEVIDVEEDDLSNDLDMNLQLRVEVMKAQVQNLVKEAELATSKFLQIKENLDTKKRQPKKQSTKGNDSSVVDHDLNESANISDESDVIEMILQKEAVLKTITDANTMSDRYDNFISQTCPSAFARITRKVDQAYSSRTSTIQDLLQGFDFNIGINSPLQENTKDQYHTHGIISFRQPNIDSQAFCKKLDHLVREGLKEVRFQQCIGKSLEGSMRRYWKHILPYSFSSDDHKETMSLLGVSPVLDSEDLLPLLATKSENFVDETLAESNSNQSNINRNEEDKVENVRPELESPLEINASPEVSIRNEGGPNALTYDVEMDSMKRKRKVVKHRERKKQKMPTTVNVCTESQNSPFLLFPTLSELRSTQKHHCSNLRSFASSSSHKRNALIEVTNVGSSSMGHKSTANAMSLLLPVRQPCGPPPGLPLPLPEEVYMTPYSLTMFNLDEVGKLKTSMMLLEEVLLKGKNSHSVSLIIYIGSPDTKRVHVALACL